MTLGGLLSAGGIGANSFRYGPVAGHVVALEAVTGHGERRCASVQENTALFESALAGLGRYAAITAATLVLRPARPHVRVLSLLYADVEPWLEDQQELIKDERCHYLEGFFWSGAKALQSGPRGRQLVTHWMYGLQLGVEFDSQTPPQDAQLLTKLKPWRVVGSVDFERGSFPLRYQPRFEAMVHSDSWRQAHPWLEAFLEEATLQTLLPAILERLPPSLGDGHRALFVNTASAPPLFALPQGEYALCFAVLPTGIPPPLLPEALTALKEIDQLIAESGGKRYLSGWLGPMDEARWRAHYGQRYDLWVERKRQFDPAGVFTSSLFNTTDGEAKRHQSP
jgi:cytokinin dehydrogenase